VTGPFLFTPDWLASTLNRPLQKHSLAALGRLPAGAPLRRRRLHLLLRSHFTLHFTRFDPTHRANSDFSQSFSLRASTLKSVVAAQSLRPGAARLSQELTSLSPIYLVRAPYRVTPLSGWGAEAPVGRSIRRGLRGRHASAAAIKTFGVRLRTFAFASSSFDRQFPQLRCSRCSSRKESGRRKKHDAENKKQNLNQISSVCWHRILFDVLGLILRLLPQTKRG
jgi:hypothetical protein